MLTCRICGSTDFRLSHFRSKDVFHLVRLSYPVRCRCCRTRDYVVVFKAVKIGHADRIRHALRRRKRLEQLHGTSGR